MGPGSPLRRIYALAIQINSKPPIRHSSGAILRWPHESPSRARIRRVLYRQACGLSIAWVRSSHDRGSYLGCILVGAPCDRCKHVDQCASEPVACLDFYNYVMLEDHKGSWWHLSKTRTPTKDYYARIYRVPRSANDEASSQALATNCANGD